MDEIQCACALDCSRKYFHTRVALVAFDNLEKTTKQLASSLCLTINRCSDASNKTTVSANYFVLPFPGVNKRKASSAND